MRLYIDAGHGGADPGAKGSTGLLEKDITLPMARVLALRASPFADVRLSRVDDRNVSERATAEDANYWGASYLVSFHCNGFDDPVAQGFEVLRHEDDEAAQPLADKIMDSMQVAFPARRRRSVKIVPEGGRGATILGVSRCPAVIFEPGFITNPDEEEWLGKFVTQAQLVEIVAHSLQHL